MENETQISQEVINEEKEIIQTTRREFFWMKLFVVSMVLVAVVGLAFYFKGILVAATVNGSPISRLAVVRELEKQAGKQALDSLVTKKLVEAEAAKKNIQITQQDIDDEIKKISAQVAAQGSTLDAALQQQGMTRVQLAEQITFQKKIEKLVGDKVAVTDQEIDDFIKNNKMAPAKGQKIDDLKTQVRAQLREQNLNQATRELLSVIKAGAKINYYVNY